MMKVSSSDAIIQMKVLIETRPDGNRDGNRGELWRTLANVGGRKAYDPYRGRTLAN